MDSQTKRNLVITFGGGVNEVMREMIAAAGLKVPRVPAVSAIDGIKAAAERVKAEGKSKPRTARHPVNQPMIDHWLDAMGDRNPIYFDEQAATAAGHPGTVAPPAMIQVWTMMGLGGVRPDDDPLGKILELFDDAGYIGVVATNCEQTYHRYLRPGEEVSVAAELTDVVGPKRTALGEGFFITQKISWTVGDDEKTVAEMMWRIMKFRPAERRFGALVRSRRSRRGLHDAARIVSGHEVLLGRRQRARASYPEAARRQPAAPTGACVVGRP